MKLTAALTLTAAALWAGGSHAQGTPPRALSVWGDFLAGHHAEAIGDGRRALDYYAAATRKGLEASPDLYSRIYILNLTEGRLDAALVALDKVEQAEGRAPLANLTRAVRALRDGDFDRAAELLDGDEGGIARIVGPVLSAWTRVGQGDVDGALEGLQGATDGETDPAPLNALHTALIAQLAGKVDVADAGFIKLRDTATLSVRTAELLGAYLERRGKPDEARAVYGALGDGAERAILLDALEARLKSGSLPAIDVDTAQDGAAEALYGVASALLAQNAWESAMALAHLSDELRPGFPPSALVAAGALEQNQRYEDANAIYAQVPDASPFSWMAQLHLANNADRLGDTAQAEKLLEKMARQRPELARPLIELGDVLRRHEDFAAAARAYSRALERIDAVQDIHWVVFYSRGIAYEQTKQWPKAEADFLRALELSPEQPLVLNYLGYSWIDQGLNLDKALKMIEKAVEQRPRDGYIVDSLGWGLYRTGDFQGAVKHLERAVMLRPADPIINDHLGDALWQVGRVREARFQWERALALEPDADLAKTLQGKLKSGLAAAKP